MKRESLNIGMTQSLRQAQIRPRLDALAQHTGVTATLIAGRALTLGLAFIEGDPRRIFPGQAEASEAPPIAPTSTTPTDAAPQHAVSPSAAPPRVEPPSTAEESAAPLCDAMHSINTQRAATASPPSLDGAEPSATPSRWVSTADAARALGYKEVTALLQHSRRHPELRKLSKRHGRLRLWDLAKLRAEYQRRQWRPR